MKKVFYYICLLLEIIAFFTSCETAPFVSMSGPDSFHFTREGGSQSFSFSCNRDWRVSSSESWIRISPSSGTANDDNITVTVSCSPNTTYDPRNATITVTVEELTEIISISQDTGLGLIVSPTTFDLTNAEQTIEVEVQQNVKYTIEIDDSCSKWIKKGGTKALSTDKVTFNISANTTYDNREGKITIKQVDGDLAQTITVRQSQTNGLFITTPEYNLSNEAHTLSVEVKANVEFEVTSQTEWIKYVETKALTPSTITLSIEANESYDNRTGTVLVKQKNGDLSGTITITQKQTDGLFVSPTSFDLTNAGQTITIEVKDNVAYRVVIPEEDSGWINIQSNTATKALNEDKVVLAISQNTTYDNRESSITIKQIDGSLAETVTIKQAYGEGLIVEKTKYNVSYKEETITVEVKANVEFDVSSEVDWIQYVETKALAPSTIVLSIKANSKAISRTGDVIISQKQGSLSSRITVTQDPLPDVHTGTVSNIRHYSAHLTGSLSMESESAKLQEVWFLYSDSSTTVDELKSNGKKKSTYMTTTNSFSANINELNYNTQYYYVACARISDTDYYGEVKSFTTRDIIATVTTKEPTYIWFSAGQLNGKVSIHDTWVEEAIVVNEVWFLYSDEASNLDDLVEKGTRINPTDYNTPSTTPSFSCRIGGLTSSTTYYYVVGARVKDKVLYGTVETFVTKTIPEGSIDIGMNVCWAPCNIGASKPEEYGSLYAWGETETKSEYEQSNYKYFDAEHNVFTKYTLASTKDNPVLLEKEDDVAHVKLGNNWRTPTPYEWNMAVGGRYKTVMNGISGYLVDDRLFFPEGIYWTSLLGPAPYSWGWAYTRELINNKNVEGQRNRYEGHMVRAVTE